ncbi:MAG: hypothetical protein LUE16_04655 [Lachnospiraceae bacterium]|nr:hypothetical protein [Lachnospiraceae bacterium]
MANARFPENITLGEDTAIIPEIIVKANVFVIQQNAVYFYRKRSTSLSNSDLTWSRFKRNIDAREQAATYLAEIVPGNEKELSEWTLKQNVMNLIGYSLKQEQKGSILAKICEQAPAIERYQDMDRVQTLKTVFGDIYRFMKGSEEP